MTTPPAVVQCAPIGPASVVGSEGEVLAARGVAAQGEPEPEAVATGAEGRGQGVAAEVVKDGGGRARTVADLKFSLARFSFSSPLVRSEFVLP